MKPDEFENRMRALEVLHSLRFVPGVWVVLRLDGRGFSRLTADRFEKPFDVRFHEFMVQTALALLAELQGAYAYTESDEISLLLPRTWDLYDRELEKSLSLSAGLARRRRRAWRGPRACTLAFKRVVFAVFDDTSDGSTLRPFARRFGVRS